MTRIFISYRRKDSEAFSGRLADLLKSTFGRPNVFFDIDSVPLGVDFREHVAAALEECDMVLVVIGPGWASVRADGTKTFNAETDYVRIEIETALKMGLPLIPVLVGETKMPSADQLPDAIESIVYRNASVIDPGRDFHLHANRLITALKAVKTSQHSVESKSPDFVPNSKIRGERPVLEIASGPKQETLCELEKDRIVIGRHPDCDLCIDSQSISKYHAQLVRLESGYAIEDLHTRNGTFVNGNRVTERHVLSDGDRIHIGPLILIYRSNSVTT